MGVGCHEVEGRERCEHAWLARQRRAREQRSDAADGEQAADTAQFLAKRKWKVSVLEET